MNQEPNVSDQLREEFRQYMNRYKAELLDEERTGSRGDRRTGSHESSTLGKRSASHNSRAGSKGSVRSLRQLVLRQGLLYMNSFPGSNDDPKNSPLSGLLDTIRYNEDYDDKDCLDYALRQLEYRFEVIDMAADRYVQFLQIPAPFGPACEDFDTEQYINGLKNLPGGEMDFFAESKLGSPRILRATFFHQWREKSMDRYSQRVQATSFVLFTSRTYS